ncbi:PREDICTED: disks large-associated protein 5 [Condylura cristata]|uniref:disks large-associated protein 5 n=1 Tax=Condylura cristata TaxID=143302 RepID=UPI0003347B34|nr:PREDICTED: disks large-associated protein 5 [Condylura cristata]
MSSSHFIARYRKDLSSEMIRTKIAHRKSLSQKENRHKEYERNRHFGLKDVNIPILEGRSLLELNETYQEFIPQKTHSKSRSQKSVVGDLRKQMLQKYKEEKQLQKLKEQREKAKQGVFKVGRFRPDKPIFLLSNKNVVKTEPTKAFQSSVLITRSKAKEQMEQTKVNNGSDIRAIRPGQRKTSEKKVLEKDNKVVQPVVPTSMRMTRSATQAAMQIVKTVTSTTARKPVTRATNKAESKSPNKGIPAQKIESDKVISFKVDSKENTLHSTTSRTDGTDLDGALSKMENLPKTNTAKTKGKNSFAPKDFMFQPLDGLKTYQVTPMTPRSADAFLTPSYTWTPLKTEVDKTQGAVKEILTQTSKTYSTKTVHQDSSKSQCPSVFLRVCNKEPVLNKSETTKSSNGLPIKGDSSLQTNEEHIPQPQHDVPYFRNVLQSETEKLTSHCLEWDKKLQLDIPDDAKDLIRTAVGQTRLLMKERFKQFEGLVDNCEYKRGEKETTCTDLDGFWDMVSFQVEDVNQKFSNLAKLEESGWQNTDNTSKNVFRKKVVSGIASKPKQNDGGRIAARNRLAAIKNAMKERIKQEELAASADSAMPKEVDKIVFDAGFFRVESPVKSFSGLSISSECLSQRLTTPKSVNKAVFENKADETDLPKQTVSPENPKPQNSKNKCVKTLLSTIPENSNSIEEGAQCLGLQVLTEVNHDGNISDIYFERSRLSSERMNLSLFASEVTYNINANKKEEISDAVEGMELNSSVISQDVFMISPEKNTLLQGNTSQEEETKISQSVPFDNKSLTTEYHLLDSPGLGTAGIHSQVEKRHRECARHVSFGGNLITFSPLRPLNGEKLEEL